MTEDPLSADLSHARGEPLRGGRDESSSGAGAELVERLTANLRAVRERIDAAARAAGRDPATVALLAVSKTHPAEAVAVLAALGQLDFAENRVQELSGKAAALAEDPAVPALRWHLVGQLQRNKAAAVVRLGATVHSVDREQLVTALARAADTQERVVDVLVQVDLGGPEGELGERGGAPPEDVPRLADAVAAAAGLRLRGLMAVAPRGGDPAPAFQRLAALAARVRADHPGASETSAGMSGDLEAAVTAGATVVRVGTALFGARPLASDAEDPPGTTARS
ncbi:YggS family pyridoxal phosphate-dependent enzyme [Modestobacter sp. VKM Ac-2986]|uniref:YggS family pyridoxal phosphate-dependent enzyme n=1 Tax=Modestobacter sp. VKM Ac-2986 TaxID=3004140 RepID=UPI0022AA869B|nr:YggS family pyridoxal phosphate-dependent enzyme [Modestobacter sp. VKM Ac-2986]MCZ2828286.1 YggS family pyridoxal phosphate-dependent enzyme [Modestobacter sp. VKM Ac-2986]